MRVVILISGRGSNMRSIIEQSTPNYQVVAVVTNNPSAAGAQYALEQGIQVGVIERHSYGSLAEAKIAVLDRVLEHAPDLVVLAGFMWVLPPPVVAALRGKLINIHPSLLPELPGLDTHKRALAAGFSRHGCTVHYVNEEVDGGPIIAQCSVPVEPSDTEETLADRVLAAEHTIYPLIVNAIATGSVRYADGKVVIQAGAIRDLERSGITVPK